VLGTVLYHIASAFTHVLLLLLLLLPQCCWLEC
jgi:hypothetical protein